MFIDTHAHLTSEQLLPQADELISHAQAVGVQKIVNICTDEASLSEGLKLQKRYPGIYNTAATTPHDVELEGESFFPIVRKAAEKKQLVALGETGLDYHYQHSPKALQQDFLSRYFELATETELPLIFHCREAFGDLFAMADAEYKGGAVLHCFTGTLPEARSVLDRGWYLSFSGIITFKKSDQLREVVKFTPLDRIFIETDAPYLAPQSKRGKSNEPAYIVEIYEMIAALKETDLKTVAMQTLKNASAFFQF
ncbi:MAG TPA: TatD family hydrolase [Rhabdochlamydiaceae bacterium]|nr:TatD family hydrolase [Rhabdochlamydiaceae bacterium]